MKINNRTFIIFFLICFQPIEKLAAQYYDQAIGGRFGTDIMIGYKQFVLYHPNPQLAWEVLVGLQLDERSINRRSLVTQTNGYVAQGMCYWHYDIGFDTGFSGFLGAGFFMGVYTPFGEKAKFGGGVAFSAGASYTFTHIPLEIALDWMPVLGSPRMSITRGAITLRYILPTLWH
jgi:hypothetical protein